jgi:hypothetical protein
MFTDQAATLGMLLTPLMSRWMRQRQQLEQRYQRLAPGSPEFLGPTDATSSSVVRTSPGRF